MKQVFTFPRFFIAVLVALTAVCSCKKDDANPVSAGPAATIMPLSTGNRWVFHDTSLDSVGGIISTERDSLFITRDTMINSERWWRMENGGPTPIIFYTNRTTGLWMTDGGSPMLLLKYPGARGDSWNVGGPLGAITLTSISTTVIVPSGTYTCYAYEFGGSRSYFAPGVGEVCEWDSASTSTGVRYLAYQRELIKYVIN